LVNGEEVFDYDNDLMDEIIVKSFDVWLKGLYYVKS
jgi:hypothetical protein